jgi:DNA repair exonuclease SbcCD ATPase subunit
MKPTKPIGPTEINKSSSEMDAEANIRELTHASHAFRQAEKKDDQTSANSLDTLLGRVSEASTREIENLIDELQTLRNKLQADGSRIRRDIMEYAGLSQQVMQVTTIISDNVKKLPAPSIIPENDLRVTA